jgi:hypothetical protein
MKKFPVVGASPLNWLCRGSVVPTSPPNVFGLQALYPGPQPKAYTVDQPGPKSEAAGGKDRQQTSLGHIVQFTHTKKLLNICKQNVVDRK